MSAAQPPNPNTASHRTPAPAGAASDPAQAVLAAAVVTRIIRQNNLAIFLIIVTGLAAVAIVETQHLYPQHPPYLWLLTTLRIIAPILALVLTGVFTNGIIRRLLAEARDGPITPASILSAFYVAKVTSIRLLTAAGLFSSACLLFGHRTVDLVLAVIPVLLLLVTRVNQGGPAVFAAFVASQRSAAQSQD